MLLSAAGEQDPAVLAMMMAFPVGPELEALQHEADLPALHRAAGSGAPDLALAWPEGQGQRQLTCLIWSWLAGASVQRCV